jgi:hypothetical protein
MPPKGAAAAAMTTSKPAESPFGPVIEKTLRDPSVDPKQACVDLDSGQVADLTPEEGIRADIIAVSHKIPEEIVIGLNARDPQWHDVYRINIVTGQRRLLLQNNQFLGVEVDDDYRPRVAMSMRPDAIEGQHAIGLGIVDRRRLILPPEPAMVRPEL